MAEDIEDDVFHFPRGELHAAGLEHWGDFTFVDVVLLVCFGLESSHDQKMVLLDHFSHLS